MLQRGIGAFALALAVPQGASQRHSGALTDEWHFPLPVQGCDAWNCWDEQASLVMDLQWRWIHNKDGYNNCLPGEFWDEELCPDGETCGRNCVVEGVDETGYTENYKVTPVERGVKLEFPKGPRMYMLESPNRYKLFRLLNREFTFDVDLSTLPCGMNAALYFVEMNADGDGTDAGANVGGGYCDAQCPHMRFIKGKANMNDWETVHCAENPDGEVLCGGHYGSLGYCCAEMDILEANREAGVYTAHPCTEAGPAICNSTQECGDRGQGITGFCDKDGCGYSPYRLGNTDFWGVGSNYAVDTSKPMTIVTQFVTSDGTDSGDLVEIRRKYIQNGQEVDGAVVRAGDHEGNSMSSDMCSSQREIFGDKPSFKEAGDLKAMGEALGRGMVMSLSIWDDDFSRMLWLDAEKTHHTQDASVPGISRGPCPFEYGTHQDMLDHADENGPMSVTFSNIKHGPIGSTYHGHGRRAASEPTFV